ncbi:hypothetical protein D3C83_231310 [compost metagenome]
MITLKSPCVSEWFSLRQPACATSFVPFSHVVFDAVRIALLLAVNSPMPTVFSMSAPYFGKTFASRAFKCGVV